MKKALLPLAAVAALGLAACSDKAQNETAEAAEAIGADANATMSEAADDVGGVVQSAHGGPHEGTWSLYAQARSTVTASPPEPITREGVSGPFTPGRGE